MHLAKKTRHFPALTALLMALLLVFTGNLFPAFAREGSTEEVETPQPANTVTPEPVLQSGNPGEEKAITLYKDGEKVDDFDTLKQAIDTMYKQTQDGSKYKYIVQINQDMELSEYTQFGWPYGEVTLTSKDPANPRTIKANHVNHVMMLGVVNGSELTIENIIIDGNQQTRLLWVESTKDLPASLTINNGAILQNGKVQQGDRARIGGAIYCQKAGFVTIKGGIIQNNEAIQAGGAISYIGTKTLSITGGEITGNTVSSDRGFGGGVVLQGRGQISGGKIQGNFANNGGGIAAGTDAVLDIKGGEINENTAKNAGGGIYLSGNSVLQFFGGRISKNQGRYGGGVTAVYDSEFVMDGKGVISENEAYTGGGVYPWGKTPVCKLISGTIEKNKATFGGGIRLRSPKTEIGSVIVRENIANYGGGIYSSLPDDESMTIDGAKLIKNEALSGGGVCLSEGGTMNFKNVTFQGNKAYYGGGIWTSKSMTVANTLFEGNEAIKSEPSILPDGKHENNGHGGAIYVNTSLAKDGTVIVDGCIFTKNTADKSGGAISVDDTKGLLQVKNNTQFIGNEATGELGHGGAIYSNWHPYRAIYDDGSVGPIENPPDADKYYHNIDTDKTTVFKDNKAFHTFTPPTNKDKFIKLLRSRTSHPGTKYDHPLNNDDVNFVAFCKVIFDKNYDTDDRIHDAFLVFEGTKLGENFPTDPERTGYTFKSWNTQKDGKGKAFTKDTVIDGDITVYAIHEKKPVPSNEPPKLVVQDKTTFKGDNLDLMTLVIKAFDKEDGDLIDKVKILDDGGFDRNTVGEYLVTFAVTDSRGAKTQAIATVTVLTKTVPVTPQPAPKPTTNPHTKVGDGLAFSLLALGLCAGALAMIGKKKHKEEK